jgi:hypothetical protein
MEKTPEGNLSRRVFLRSLAYGAVGLSLGLVSNLEVQAQQYAPIRYSMKGFNESQYGEESLIRRAMSHVHYRFRSMWVLENAYRMSGNAYNIMGGYWEDCRMDRQAQLGYVDLLRYQITRLAAAVPFPDVVINANHAEREEWGDAEMGIVKVLWAGTGINLRGRFKIRLNRYHLAAGGEKSNPVAWASVIAHEMLHNLGHDHVGYSVDQQINAFTTAVYCNGAC